MIYRVSNVEAFRQYEADDEAEADDLIAGILGQREPSEAMLAGTAFHKALETAQEGESARVEALGHVFTFACEVEVEAAPVRELRASKTYMVDGEPITISGQVDALFGRRIDDHKTTSRFDPDRYIAGYQWRLYLDIFGADLFRWNVFELRQVESTTPTDGFDLPPPEYEVFAHHRLEQFRYPALASDCQRLVERFARFVRDRVEAVA